MACKVLFEGAEVEDLEYMRTEIGGERTGGEEDRKTGNSQSLWEI